MSLMPPKSIIDSAPPAALPSNPSFFGGGREAPDFSRAERVILPRLRQLRVPAPLIARSRQAAAEAVTFARGRTRGGARSFEHRLLHRISFGPTTFELAQIEAEGFRPYLERQLQPEGIDDFGLEEALVDAFPTLAMRPLEIALTFGDQFEVPIFELIIATLIRRIYSPRQLFERMVAFWSDHFNIDILSDFGTFFKSTDDREVIRRHALGRFPDLLRASARSPAMLDYLTNDSNVKGRPNENYARELMELHSLGADGGFSQEDVREVARCFTGWTFGGLDSGADFGEFLFQAADHDAGEKTVIGHLIPAGGGAGDVERVLEILVDHPSSGPFIARKMLRWIWGYEPDARTVERLARIYFDTSGDIRAMLRSALLWADQAVATPKLKRPQHLVASALRALFADVQEPFFVVLAVLRAGHMPFFWRPPDGYPDRQDYWSGFLLERWNFGAEVALPGIGIGFDTSFLNPSMSPEQVVGVLDALLLGGTASEGTRNALEAFLASRPRNQESLREVVGLILASPEFQYY